MSGPYTWPSTLAPDRGRVRLRSLTSITRNPFTGATLRQKRGQALWTAEYTYSARNRTNVASVRALIAKAEGPLDTFYLPLFNQPDTQGFQADNSSITLGANAALNATSLTLNNLDLGTGVSINAGSIIGVDTARAYVILDDLTDGGTSVDIWPPVRQAASSGDACSLQFPTVKMHLVSDDAFEESFSEEPTGEITVSFVEALET